jgi:hypothetical protein
MLPFDTTADTTQSATLRNPWQPPAKEKAYLSRFCNIWQHIETGFGGLWLRWRESHPLPSPSVCGSDAVMGGLSKGVKYDDLRAG